MSLWHLCNLRAAERLKDKDDRVCGAQEIQQIKIDAQYNLQKII